MSQMPNVNSKYGAPMGRSRCGLVPSGKVRLFRVRINSGGYDDGGAYWGHGLPLYCATDDLGFMKFTRAYDRLDAAKKLGLENSSLKRPMEDNNQEVLMKLPVSVGKNCSEIKRFATLKEGEDFITEIAKTDPEGVERGDYYVDAPEEMVNPPH